jgi:hypothetical protein
LHIEANNNADASLYLFHTVLQLSAYLIDIEILEFIVYQ